MSRTALALDLGGTHVSAGRVDLAQARIDEWLRIALPPRAGRDALLERIVGAARKVGAGVDAVGFAAPGPFDYAAGVSRIGHKLEALYGVDFRTALADGLGLAPETISFVNDADAFVLGEWVAGAARGSRRVVGVTLGTGLGSGFLADGRLVHSGSAVPPCGEIHRVSYRGAPVEESLSRAAVIRRYGDPGVDVDEIARRARRGDERALAAFEDAGSVLGEVLRPWLEAFGATTLVVGGSIAAAWDVLEPALRTSLACIDPLETVARASLIDEAALIGAAYDACRSQQRPKLNPQSEALRRARVRAGTRPLHELTVDEARAAQAAEHTSPQVDAYTVDTFDADGPVPIRIYRPPSAEPLPVCVWLVGGGWVLDTLPAAEPVCRRIASETPCAIAAVRYRLAPEHRFPVPVEDCVAATRWLRDHAAPLGLDPGRVAIGGTSAGANLAAAVTLLARDSADMRFDVQVLVYPVLVHDDSRRRGVPGEAGPFGALDVAWCWSHYLADQNDGANPLASPLLAEDLSRLPPALVLTAELDPLRDEGERYAERLAQAGVPVELRRFDGVPHGFFSLLGLVDAADEAQLLVIETLRKAFGGTR